MELLKKIGKSLIIGTIMGLVVAVLTAKFVPDLIDRLEHQSYYWRYQWKYWINNYKGEGVKEIEDCGIYIIDIDDRSMHKLGNYWNWNRSYHAKLINSLSTKFPAALTFDINFYDPEDDHARKRISTLIEHSKTLFPQALSLEEKAAKYLLESVNYDQQFIEATQKSGVVYHNVRMSDFNDYAEVDKSQIKVRSEIEWHKSLKPSSTIKVPIEKRKAINTDKNIVDGIFSPLAAASRDIGHLNMTPNTDGYIREIPLLYSFGKNIDVYLPMSMRVAATLFGTPNEEIIIEPNKYVDIGRPFKIFKDKNNEITYSYPNMTTAQIKIIIENREKILALKPNEELIVSSFTKIGIDPEMGEYVSMYHGDFPQELINIFRKKDILEALKLEIGKQKDFGDETIIRRDSELEWVLETPYGWAEYYLDATDIKILSSINIDDFLKLKPGDNKLIYHTFTVKNKNGELLSSIPIFRDETLRELCNIKWTEITEMPPGTRKDVGKNVRIPLTPYNKHIVTYFGRQKQTFRYYSYYDIMEDRVQGELEGKIFIVGSTVPAMFDIVNTPVSQNYPGVEVHASLIHSFITNKFINRLEPWQDFAMLILVGIFVGIIAYLLKPIFSSTLSAITVFVYLFVGLYVFETGSLWIEMVRPIITIIFTYTTVMAYRYVTEEKDRKFLQNTFKTYLSPELIDTMYKEKQMPKLGGDEGVRTAFFTDIQGFSTFSEKLGSPTRLVELLNEYLTEMTDSLLAHYGTLDKYEGDAIIAFYGAPMEMADHAQQACATALDMQRKLAVLRDKWIGEGDKWPEIVHNMRMRIGINTGRITTGNMGSAVRMNYTMMGDAVNLAARLESAAKQYGIYTMISQDTYNIVKGQFEARQLDKITVVGKSEPVIVYELLSEKGQLAPEIKELVDMYNDGLKLFYDQQWDKAIEVMTKSEVLEPYKHVSSGGISPSRKIIGYCESFKAQPPGDNWDGVIRLTSK